MKHFDLDWGDFLGGLPVWESLPVPARQAVLAIFAEYPLNQVVPRGTAGPLEGILLSSRMVVPAAGQRPGFRLADDQRLVVRVLKDLARVPVLDAEPAAELLGRYVLEHLSLAECAGLTCQESYFTTYGTAAHLVASSSWLSDFLTAPNPQAWEDQHLPERANFRALHVPAVARLLRQWVERLIAEDGPVSLGELARSIPAPPEVVRAALRAGLRHVLLLGGLRPSDLLPIVGLWPPARQRLAAPPPEPPAAVIPQETAAGGHGLDDLFTFLAACQAQPPRLRQQDLQIFAKAEEEIEAALPPLPEWLEQALRARRAARLGWATHVAWNLDWVEVRRIGGKPPVLALSPAGERWLAASERERLRLISPPRPKAKGRQGGGKIPAAPAHRPLIAAREGEDVERILAAFATVPADVFFDLGAFLEFESRQRNPLAANPQAVVYRHYQAPQTAEDREQDWQLSLSVFFSRNLVPLGGATLGYTAEGRICFAITPIGRYLLGEADDFVMPERAAARIVVQPNFDIVFLTLSPTLEATLSRFAERRSRGLGTLFQITKKSIHAAAAGGLDARKVLAILEGAATQAIPGNVRREIEAWFGGVRTVKLAPALLLDCPDAETAARVVAAGGQGTELLGDTVVALRNPANRTELTRKLRAGGIFVEEEAPAAAEPISPPYKKAKRRRRRW